MPYVPQLEYTIQAVSVEYSVQIQASYMLHSTLWVDRECLMQDTVANFILVIKLFHLEPRIVFKCEHRYEFHVVCNFLL